MQSVRHRAFQPELANRPCFQIIAVEDCQSGTAGVGVEHHSRHPHVRFVDNGRRPFAWPWDHDHLLAKRPRRRSPHLRDLYAESGQTLQGSFSAVSVPNFASKYSLELAGKLSPRSTQCVPLHRSPISKFQPKIVNIFSRMNNEFPIFLTFCVEFCIF